MSSILAGERLQLVVDAHEVAGAGSGVVGQHTLRKVHLFSFPSEYNSLFIKKPLGISGRLALVAIYIRRPPPNHKPNKT